VYLRRTSYGQWRVCVWRFSDVYHSHAGISCQPAVRSLDWLSSKRRDVMFPGDVHDACLTTSIISDNSLGMGRRSAIFDISRHIGFVASDWPGHFLFVRAYVKPSAS